MPADAIKKCAHDIVNRFQEVLLFLESERCQSEHHRRAEFAIKKAIPLLFHLQRLVAGLEETDEEQKST